MKDRLPNPDLFKTPPEKIRIALIDGKQFGYDVAVNPGVEIDRSLPSYGTYLGRGVIYSIDGSRQVPTDTYDFYLRK